MIFKMIVDNESAQITVLKALHQVWKNHQQMMVVIVDKMLKTQIVECSSVVNWIFSSSMKADFTKFYVWEILHSTLNRMNKHVIKFQQEYQELSNKTKNLNSMETIGDGDDENNGLKDEVKFK
jgi:nuclear cap-binding protein subunit 1